MVNLGRVGIVPQGAYDEATEYKKLDLVTEGGSAYLYTSDTPGTGVDLSDPAWLLVVEKGPQGEQGIQGLKGDTGNGIVSVLRTSGDGTPGTTDTYTITFDDDSTTTFPVYNGADGDIINIKVDGATKTKAAGVVDLTSDFARYALWRKTASGNPVSVYPVPESPLYARVSGMPIQEGEGDPSPSNIRPITPWLASGASVSIVQTDGATITLTAPQEILAGWMDNEGNGQVTHRSYTFVGTETFDLYAPWSTETRKYFYGFILPGALGVEGATVPSAACSIAAPQHDDNWYQDTSLNKFGINISGAMKIVVPASVATDAATLKTFFANMVTAGTPVTVYYQLATPIPITHTIAPLTASPQLDRITPRQNVLTASTGNIELTYAKSPIQESNEIRAAIALI